MSSVSTFGGKKLKRGEQDFYLQITSLIDTLVIILVFMLMTIGSGSVNLEMAQGVRLPWALAGAELTQGLKVVARLDGITAADQSIVQNFEMSDGVVDKHLTAEAGRKIVPLFDKMAQMAADSKKAAEKTGVKFEGRVLFQADKDVPLKTVRQIMYTAARAGYNDFRFAVVRQ